MSGRRRQLGQHRAYVPGKLLPARFAAAALLALVHTSGASEPRSPVERQDQRTAANQSVALEVSTSSQDKGDAAGKLPDGDVLSESGRRPEAGGQVSASAGSSTAIKARDFAAGNTQVGKPETPWYRTGIGALAIVLAVVAAVYWLVRRWIPGARSSDSGVLRVVARTALTPKHSATLIQMGRRFLLVGVSPDRVEALCEITDPDEVAELTARAGVGALAGGKVFDRILAGESAGFRAERDDSPERPPADSSASPTGLSGQSAGEPARTSGPLADLLRRLRALQMQSQ